MDSVSSAIAPRGARVGDRPPGRARRRRAGAGDEVRHGPVGEVAPCLPLDHCDNCIAAVEFTTRVFTVGEMLLFRRWADENLEAGVNLLVKRSNRSEEWWLDVSMGDMKSLVAKFEPAAVEAMAAAEISSMLATD